MGNAENLYLGILGGALYCHHFLLRGEGILLESEIFVGDAVHSVLHRDSDESTLGRLAEERVVLDYRVVAHASDLIAIGTEKLLAQVSCLLIIFYL